MEHQKKLDWLHKIAKLGLEHVSVPEQPPVHLASGGTLGGAVGTGAVAAGPAGAVSGAIYNGISNNPSPSQGNFQGNGYTNNSATNPNTGVIGSINNALGLNNQFIGQSANIQSGTNASQINNAYNTAQSGITQQQGVASTLTPGIQQGAAAESTLEGQLANEAAGQGPNPAAAALNQATGQNISQAAALAAGTRGASSNAGAIANNAANSAATTQQSAIGQAATLEAQQQLAAQQEQASLAGNQINQGSTAVQGVSEQAQNEQNILQGANTSFNNAAVGMQSNLNNVNSQTSAANQNMAANTLGGMLSGISSVSSMFAKGGMVKMDKGGNVLDANARKHIAPENFALPGRRYPIHDVNHARNALARVSQNGTPAEKAKVKAAVNKKYPSLAAKKMAAGGGVGCYDDGGDVSDQVPAWQNTPSDTSNGPSIGSSSLPSDNANFGQDAKSSSGGSGGGGGGASGIMSLAALMAKGGQVPVHHGFMKMMAAGGYTAPIPLIQKDNGPQSFVGKWINSSATATNGPNIGATGALPADSANLAKDVPQGQQQKQQPKQDSPDDSDEQIISGDPMDGPANNDLTNMDSPRMTAYSGGLAASGGNVKTNNPKQKAVVKGDSLKNDKVPALLSEGEVVIDRDTLNDAGPLGKMARAVAAHIEARNKKK